MRKQESVHLHALLLEVASYLDDRPETPPVDRSKYHELGIGPSSVHRSKGAHEEAVMVLAGTIGDSIHRSAEQGHEPPIQ